MAAVVSLKKREGGLPDEEEEAGGWGGPGPGGCLCEGGGRLKFYVGAENSHQVIGKIRAGSVQKGPE